MPYAKPSDVPDNVPVKYKPQFMEVWNSVYAAGIAAKKSPAQAEEDAFKQSHGVINKAKAKDSRDVSADGPGFGPVEGKSEDGGQVSDPQQTLRYSEDQPRDADGKFSAGDTGEKAHTTEEHLKAASDHLTLAKQEAGRGNKDKEKAHQEAARKHVDAGFANSENKEAVGNVARTASAAANKRP
jgi:hypothetical protein